ncbi:glycosyl transferase family protein [Hyphobacterium sp. HN65]|uniref:Glycosyl transferase family protein n=1 Tax=Hyphobacterium lacteum TaxID=3116575 RepID=A0ABU7LV74_9PROT|nr:glycosyl transferase family protein [Hyphobacterium sp. HN65]MEE2527234.1 glycosyl transferase family protein [Hyphobacterium sp. HN65]
MIETFDPAIAQAMAFDGGVGVWIESALADLLSGDAFRTYWTVLGWLTVYAAIAIFISSADDAFLDLYFWVLTAQRVITRPFRFVPSQKRLDEMDQKKLAVMVPAWHEADVIGRMLVNTLKTMDYRNYEIFVGVYPNDQETINEVERIVRQNPGINIAYVGHNGPTCKADNLNWMIAGIVKREAELGQMFDGVVMQDSEDVIHPMSFKVINAYLDRADMLQLPVLSMPRKWSSLTACHYMDEFAEWHGKDLIARSHMTDLVPSAGVATAFSREAIELLRKERHNQPFNVDSLTEDYDIGHRFYEAGLKSLFVRYWARMPYAKRKAWIGGRDIYKYRRELVCTREFFPDIAKISVRQKSRWMLGISYLGWKQLGWIGPPSHRYFLYRDRKAIWTAPTGMLAYAILLQWALYWLIATVFPQAGKLPPLIDPNSWVWTLVLINFVFLVNRVIHRLIFTGWAHGLKYAALAPVRMVWANWIGYLASMRAARRYIWHVISGKQLTWDKTMHAYPSMAELGQGEGNRLGEALIYWGAIDETVLQRALALQADEYRPLGLLLLDLGEISDDQLADGVAEHMGWERVDLDPLAAKPDLLRHMPRAEAAKYGAFPVAREGRSLTIAVGEPLSETQLADLRHKLGRHLKVVVAPLSDVSFGIRFAYEDREVFAADFRAARVLRKLSILDDDQIRKVWRSLRQDWARLGDHLVRRGAISHTRLLTEQKGVDALDEAELGETLVQKRLIKRNDLLAATAAQPQPPLGFVQRARALGYLTDVEWTEIQEAHADLIMEDA